MIIKKKSQRDYLAFNHIQLILCCIIFTIRHSQRALIAAEKNGGRNDTKFLHIYIRQDTRMDENIGNLGDLS